ncbi:MAG: hypothetical protein CMO46_01705 [Verrucomicrobiales bacterium]|nr:hypothetical protein [Verrucomicrobiales bacterium]|tara:strand:+ start:485 stop:844 length:360 start_codon:yes stop_codon:yes gene_type:complete
MEYKDIMPLGADTIEELVRKHPKKVKELDKLELQELIRSNHSLQKELSLKFKIALFILILSVGFFAYVQISSFNIGTVLMLFSVLVIWISGSASYGIYNALKEVKLLLPIEEKELENRS